MPAFFLALLAAAVATLGGREAVRVARLSAGLGKGAGLPAALWIGCIATSALAGWLGGQIAPLLFPAAKQMFVALALLLGALEIWVLRAPRAPAEPTRSFPAILIVLTAAQATDAARFLILALAVATGAGGLAAAGGALGSGAALTAAWALGAMWEKGLPLAALRWGAGGLLLIAAIATGLIARGAVG